jgi:hypothetical protein
MILLSASWRARDTWITLRPLDLVLLVIFAAGVLSSELPDRNASLPAVGALFLAFLALVGLHLGARALALHLQRVSILRASIGLYGSTIETESPWSGGRAELIAGVIGAAAAGLTAGLAWRAVPNWSGSDALVTSAVAFAVLQLLPALPLDGGRILWGLLWPILDDDLQSARVVHRYGWIVVAGLGLFGAVLIARSADRPYWGLAAVAVAVELGAASSAMLTRRAWRSAARRVRLADAGVATVTMVDAAEPISSVVSVLLALENAGILVERDQQPAGAVTIDSLQRSRRAHWSDTGVGAIMTPLSELPTIDPQVDLAEAIDFLDRAGASVAKTQLNGRPALVTRQSLATATPRPRE